jgi:hypothetical protein
MLYENSPEVVNRLTEAKPVVSQSMPSFDVKEEEASPPKEELKSK